MNEIGIRHLVLFSFHAGAEAAAIATALARFRALPQAIDEVLSFEDGENVSPEGLGRGYAHAFVLGFADAAARDRYLDHPAHRDFVSLVQPLVAKALVFDYVCGGRT